MNRRGWWFLAAGVLIAVVTVCVALRSCEDQALPARQPWQRR